MLSDAATIAIYTLSYTTLFRSTGYRFASRLVRSGMRGSTPSFKVYPSRGWRKGGRGGSPVTPRRSKRRALHVRSEEHTSELQSPCNLVCRLLLEKKKDMESSKH